MAIVILRGDVLPKWLGFSGVALAIGIAFGLTEPVGFGLGARSTR